MSVTMYMAVVVAFFICYLYVSQIKNIFGSQHSEEDSASQNSHLERDIISDSGALLGHQIRHIHQRPYNSVEMHVPHSPSCDHPGLEPSGLGMGFTESFDVFSIKVAGGLRSPNPRSKRRLTYLLLG